MNVFRLTRKDTFIDDAPRTAIVIADDETAARSRVQSVLCNTGCVWQLPSTVADYGSLEDIFNIIGNSGHVLAY